MVPTTTDTRTIRQPIEHVDKTIIDKLLTDLAAVPEGHYWTVDEGDPLYIAPTDALIVPAATVRDPERDRDFGEEFLLGDIYDLNGRRIPLSERPEGWLEQQEEIRKPGSARYDENAAHRLGDDYIMIGRGQMFLRGETTIDGERAFEVISYGAYVGIVREKQVQERRDFLDANPIIEASKPWWATDVYVSEDDLDGGKTNEVHIEYTCEISVDDLSLFQEGTLTDGKVTLDEVTFRNGVLDVSVAEWPTAAGDLRRFADVLARLSQEAS